MSSKATVEITCPACGSVSNYSMWRSINTAMSPGMKEAVRDRSAFAFVCPHCGKKCNVDYGFLYHQMEDAMMIQYAQGDEAAADAYRLFFPERPDEELIDVKKENYLIRIVRSQNELLEKLAIFDAGLDDRVIEIYKLLCLADIQDKRPELQEIQILFLNDNGQYILEILTGHKSIGYVEVSTDTYQLIQDSYCDRLPDMRTESPFVDRPWALEFLGAAKG